MDRRRKHQLAWQFVPETAGKYYFYRQGMTLGLVLSAGLVFYTFFTQLKNKLQIYFLCVFLFLSFMSLYLTHLRLLMLPPLIPKELVLDLVHIRKFYANPGPVLTMTPDANTNPISRFTPNSVYSKALWCNSAKNPAWSLCTARFSILKRIFKKIFFILYLWPLNPTLRAPGD